MQTRITEYYDKRKRIYIIPNLFLFFFSINMVTILHVNIPTYRHAIQRFFIILSSSELTLTTPSLPIPCQLHLWPLKLQILSVQPLLTYASLDIHSWQHYRYPPWFFQMQLHMLSKSLCHSILL